MDVGTNGEIVIGNSEWMVTAACSAGPAFEGGGIRHGIVATDGAIEEFDINQDNNIDLYDSIDWYYYGRPDISNYIADEILTGDGSTDPPVGGSSAEQPVFFFNGKRGGYYPYYSSSYWDGETNSFPSEEMNFIG